MKSLFFSLAVAGLISSTSFALSPAPATSHPSHEAETARIEQIIHDYLIKKPEVLVEALQILERKQYEQTQQTIKETQRSASSFSKELFHQSIDPILGNPKGKITIVEFFDYQCPHCIEMVPVIDQIIQKNPDLRIVYKEFPIRGPLSDLAARAALAAALQGKYLPMSHALFASNQALTEPAIMAIAQKVGINVDQLKKDMHSTAITEQLKNNAELGRKLKLFGTPAFFIGLTNSTNQEIQYIPGRMEAAQLQRVIDKTNTLSR